MEMNIFSNANEFDYYNQGKSFLEAAQRCIGEQNENGEFFILKNSRLLQLPAPAVVNAAFACEMFFKALLIHFDVSIPKSKHGHDLENLFLCIPEKERKVINDFFCGNGKKSTLSDLLHNHASDFVRVRYFIENKGFYSMSPIFMYTFAFNLRATTYYMLYCYKRQEFQNE